MGKITRGKITQERLEADYHKYLREREKAERELYKNSPEGIANAKLRANMQEKYRSEEQMRENQCRALLVMKESLMKHILEEVGIDASIDRNAEIDQDIVDQVMQKYQSVIDNLKKWCIEYEKLDGKNSSYIYVKLYRDLISVNQAFIKYAPVETFYKHTVLTQFKKSTCQKYRDHFVKQGFFKDKKFKEKNNSLFVGVSNFSTISDYETAKKEIRVNPELYLEINEVLKDTLFANDLALKGFIHTSPAIMCYMTEEEIMHTADIMGSAMGLILVRNPEIVKNLPKDFFVYFPARTIFQGGATKALIHEKLSQYYDLFPALKQYTKSYVAQISIPTPTDEQTL